MEDRLRKLRLDTLGSCAIPILTALNYTYGVCSVIPEILGDYPTALILVDIIATWLAFCILSNFFLILKRNSSISKYAITRDSTADELMEKADKRLKPGDRWHKCEICKVIVPPRAWHCRICKRCVLRRDHHCVYTGCCIGQENQSNFMGLLFYLAFGATVATVLTLVYHLYIVHEGILDFLMKSVIIFYNLYCGFDAKHILSGASFFGVITAGSAFVFYVYISVKGQTSADAHRKVYWNNSASRLRVWSNELRKYAGLPWTPTHSPDFVAFSLTH